jgi:hypothetical protein
MKSRGEQMRRDLGALFDGYNSHNYEAFDRFVDIVSELPQDVERSWLMTIGSLRFILPCMNRFNPQNVATKPRLSVIPVHSKQFSDEVVFCRLASPLVGVRCFYESFPNSKCKSQTTF